MRSLKGKASAHATAPPTALQAREFEGNPLELSYFLLSNLPVDDDVRQQLLEAHTGGWVGWVGWGGAPHGSCCPFLLHRVNTCLPVLELQHQGLPVCLPAVDERLRAECKLLQALGALGCKACGSSLARSADAVQMSEEGISACYVNSHSFVHDIVTLSQVR